MEEIKLVGWQSWTDCTNPKTLFSRIRYFSPFGKFAKTATINKQQKQKLLRGWSSWPYFGRNITQEPIIEIAEWIKQNKKLIPPLKRL